MRISHVRQGRAVPRWLSVRGEQGQQPQGEREELGWETKGQGILEKFASDSQVGVAGRCEKVVPRRGI
jgi:hypothetical protein